MFIEVLVVALVGTAAGSYLNYLESSEEASMLASVKAEAKTGKTVTAEKALRTHPDFWLKKTFTVSDYLAMLDAGKLTIIGLPDASAFKSARPLIYLVTSSGELGNVPDTWKGSLTERSMANHPAGQRIVAVGTISPAEGISFGEIMRILVDVLIAAAILVSLKDMLPGGGGKFSPTRDVSTRFSDVIGAADAKAALQDVVNYLKDPEAYSRVGATPSRGVLMSGPPGTGKTLLAKALAGECGVSFIACSGADFSSKFFGVGITMVKSLFARARKEGAAIIFIDEIDGIGRRSSNESTGQAEQNRIINQFLIELDGFNASERIIVIGATNFVDNIDPALIREGRFDRKIELRLPDVVEREQLLRYYSRKLTVSPDIDFAQLARLTLGLSPAAVAALVNQGALRAARAGSSVVSMQHLTDAVETTHLGEVSGAMMSEDERYKTAVHEAGHALLSVIRKSGNVEKVTIIPRTNALGVTFISHEDSVKLETKTSLNHHIDVLLAGRAAEQLVFGESSNGAGSDLHRATAIATDMLNKFGFGSGLAVVTKDYLTPENHIKELNELLATRYKETCQVLEQHMSSLKAVASLLMRDETVDGAIIKAMVGHTELHSEA
ncbi:cell division protease FtsH [Novimethylophilus kurashikiensis]|uniref:Cell division protease FtsH n=1 Tax=Novimethylophilus kurashikiensis TaxID=1825523 RepID=A0A2R5F9I6_9PROT|nr:AAA family ATPase [Novimethylophilus kurashikiensis]GBG14479.1 cell division protease FtsH [Novimethylophilus kurashikiensis]